MLAKPDDATRISSAHVSDVVPLDAASQVWQRLSGRIELFIEAWEAGGEPPSIADHLDQLAPLERRMAAIELIKVDLEYRWLRRKQPRLIEAYLADFAFLADDVPVDLLYEELHIRRQLGETTPDGDLLRRFPKHADELRRLIGADSVLKTTTLAANTAKKRPNFLPGDRIDDFDLLRRLGEGAFGDVFLARQRSMQRLVALKVSADRGTEPQTLAQLDHEHIVRVYDQRQLAADGLRLMYMQYVKGGVLQSIIERLEEVPVEQRTGADYLRAIDTELLGKKEDPPVDSTLRNSLSAASWPQVVCRLGASLARALDYAHKTGILHRDIKPANILLTAEGSPKLADFNISFNSKVDGATPAAYFGGSLAYMSPEQLEACNPAHDRKPEDLDGRSDIYSLGIVLWELLTGRRPFAEDRVEGSWGRTLEQMTKRRREGPPSQGWPRAVAEDTPGLHKVLAKCLSPEVGERFASGADLARQLELCLHPATQKLLMCDEAERGRFYRRHPVVTLTTLGVLPNAASGVFNYIYNYIEIIQTLPGADQIFQRVQSVINLTVYVLGIAWGYYRMHDLAKFVADDDARAKLDDARCVELRRRTLIFGHDITMLSIFLWVAAGISYPTALHFGLNEVPANVYFHFFGSLLLCGLIAAAYPFIAVSVLCLRHYYPLFVRLDAMRAGDRSRLERLRKLSWVYLGVAAMVPMVSVALLALIGSQAVYALGITAVGGIVGFLAGLIGLRRLNSDIDALVITTQSEIRRPATQAQ